MKVAGMRSEKYLRVSATSAPFWLVSEMLCSSSTRTRPVRVVVQTPTTASMRSVMFERRRTGRPRKRANSAATMRAVAAGGTVM
jgi:hypothetical protein